MNIVNIKGKIVIKPRFVYKKPNQIKGIVTIEEEISKKRFQIVLWNNVAKEIISNCDIDDILTITAKLDSRIAIDRNGGTYYNLTIHAKSYDVQYSVLS